MDNLIMNLTKGLRTASLALMLSAATMSCMTTTPWRNIGVQSNQIGAEKTIIRNIGTSDIDTKNFSISDAYLEGEIYKTKVAQSLERKTYKIEGKNSVKRVENIALEQREEQTDLFNPIIVGLGTAGGVYAGGELGGEDGRLGGALLGGLVGFLGSAMFAGTLHISPITTKTETRKSSLGTKDVSSGERTEESLLSDVLVYKSQAARNVLFGFVGDSKNYKTNNDGIIEFGESSAWFATKSRLEKRLYELPLVKEIKPETRGVLKERLLNSATEKPIEFNIETREQSSNPNLVIKNASKKLKLDGYELKDDAIYEVVHQFVDEEINPSVKIIKFNVKDDLTHVPIRGANFEFSTDAPSKSDLLGKYFTGRLKVYAERFIPDYLFGNGKLESLPNNPEFLVYSPSNIFLEVTHPEYNFVDGEIKINGNIQKTVYMIDKGSKVRLQNSEEVVGRIE